MSIQDDLPSAPRLLAHHRQILKEESGISDAVIDALGCVSISLSAQDQAWLKARKLYSCMGKPGYLIPTLDIRGDVTTYQLRLDEPYLDENGKLVKYKSPRKKDGFKTHLNFPPGSRERLETPKEPIFFTEGVKKGASAASRGILCLTIAGVDMFAQTDEDVIVDIKTREKPLLPEFDDVPLKGRPAYIIFDSDINTKEDVERAANRFRKGLAARGATVEKLQLPPGPDGAKVGLDDWLVARQHLSDAEIKAELLALPQVRIIADGAGKEHSAKVLTQFAEMNRTLAVLLSPAGNMIREDLENSQQPYELTTLPKLALEFANKPGAPPGGWLKGWSEWPGRREFKRIVFEPGLEVEGCYNLWSGWGRIPKQMDIQLFWDFVKDIICAGDGECYTYVRKWMAYAVQRVRQLPRTALNLHSIEGTGKNTFTDWFLPIFGRHTFSPTSLEHIAGHFNAHLASAIVVVGHEALWGGDKRIVGTLKALITDERKIITGKGKDTIEVSNYTHGLFTSNSDNPLPIGRTDRRFVTLEVSDAKRDDVEYFKRLAALRDNGGIEGLMWDLEHEDISTFNPTVRPASQSAKFKLRSADPLDQWLQGVLMDGEIRYFGKWHAPDDHDCYIPWEGDVPKNLMYDSFIREMRGTRYAAMSPAEFWGKVDERDIIDTTVSKDHKATVEDPNDTSKLTRTRAVRLLPLSVARTNFAKGMREPTIFDGAGEVREECQKCAERAREKEEHKSDINYQTQAGDCHYRVEENKITPF